MIIGPDGFYTVYENVFHQLHLSEYRDSLIEDMVHFGNSKTEPDNV
jgi:hypothetical protein